MKSVKITTKYLSCHEMEETRKLFQKLYNARLYTNKGVFSILWRNGCYDSSCITPYTGYISIAWDNKTPIGVAYLPKGEYYTYDRDAPNNASYLGYGFVGVYVRAKFRSAGLGRKLLNNVLRRSKAPMVWIEGRAAGLVETPTKLVRIRSDFSIDFPQEVR